MICGANLTGLAFPNAKGVYEIVNPGDLKNNNKRVTIWHSHPDDYCSFQNHNFRVLSETSKLPSDCS